MTLLRHLLSILALPFVVVVVVPRWLLGSYAAATAGARPGSASEWLMRIAGVLVFASGLALFAWCVSLFARVGRGTLAPWDPTRALVAVGPYRYVRNPMISAVATMLLGEALFWQSWAVARWLLIFATLNHVYFLLSEEPGLERRFGAAYREYKAAVPRWVPRPRRLARWMSSRGA